MYRYLKSRLSVSLLSALICLTAISAFACSIPVFRYALEKWDSDLYQIVIFHKGKLTKEMKEVKEIVMFSTEEASENANIKIRMVDLDANPEEKWLDLWKQQKSQELPYAVVLNPLHQPQIVWKGKPTKKKLKSLVDSPLRQKIARQLLDGKTAVWVLLEGKEKKENDAAFATLTKELAHLQKTLKLPEVEEKDAALVSADIENLKISFPLIRLSKNDPAEAMFIEMLLASEDDLRSEEYVDEPIAFPIFGRGRVLYGLAGLGITQKTIAEACHFMVGSCSCEIKEQNPGTDLLMKVDWDKHIEDIYKIDTSSPPLTGITAMIGTTTKPVKKTPVKKSASDTIKKEVAVKTTANLIKKQAPRLIKKQDFAIAKKQAEEISSPTLTEESGSLIRNTMIFLGVCIMLVIGMSVFLASKTS